MNIQITRYDGQHGGLPGLLKRENPAALHHNLHMVEQSREELLFPLPVDRDRYLLLHVPVSIVNLGTDHFRLPNLFQAPDHYLPKQENTTSRPWLVGTRFVRFVFKVDGEPVPREASPWVNVTWDLVNPLGDQAIPSGNFGDFEAGISAGRAISTLDTFTPIDITDLGDVTFSFTVGILDPLDPTKFAAEETIRLKKEGIGTLHVLPN